MPDDRPLTLLTIVSAGSTEPEATAHTRSWEIPVAVADVLARWLTVWHGHPVEGFVPVGSMVDLARVQGHLFVSGEGDDGG